IVHFRSAMLDSTMLFFSALTVLAFLLLVEYKDHRRRFTSASILFGVSFACALLSKAFGLIFILFVPFLLWILRKDLSTFVRFAWVGLLAFAIPFIGIWQTHFALAGTIHPSLSSGGYYRASAEYKEILHEGRN